MNRITRILFFFNAFALLLLSPMNKGLSAYSYFDNLIDSTTVIDSAAVEDSLSADTTAMVPPDTLAPIYAKGYLSAEGHGVIINKETLQKNDYRYSGDLFKYTQAGFVYDLGSLGQPNEISIYGKGFGNISYFADGVGINNRITNSFDMYNLQSEYIDSLEIMPLPKGFLYGTENNPVSAAAYTIDTVSFIPVSRIRFFQAPDNESYFDASFSAYIFNRLNFSFDFTNSKISSRFDNSNYGGWRASAKLRYMLSNKINFIAGYNYLKTETELNGGSAALNKDAVNYDNLLEAVVYPTSSVSGGTFSSRYQKTGGHYYYLKLLGRFFDDSQTELTLYKQYRGIEFRQNERTEITGMPVILDNNNYTASGLAFKQDFNVDLVNIKILSNYESVKFDTDVLTDNSTKDKFTLAGVVSMKLLGDRLIPSFFTKYLNDDGNGFTGTGADLNYNLSSSINLYGGYSEFERQLNPLFTSPNKILVDPIKQKIKTMEIGAKYNQPFLKGSASFFSTRNDNELFYTVDRSNNAVITNEASGYFVKGTEISGVNINMNLSFWNLLLTANYSYYLNHEDEKLTLPQHTLFSGIYYVDTLFNSNLKLKAGINFYMNGSQNYFSYDFERSTRMQYANTGSSITLISNETSDASYQLDLFAAGQFQDAAIVYITFENILGFNYYIVPYFPKQPRTLRFGISWEFLN